MAVKGPDLLNDVDRATALSVIDSWKAIAERKDTECSAAYALLREKDEALKAMTVARDLCKSQTQDVSDRLLALKQWLLNNHPDAYDQAEGTVL